MDPLRKAHKHTLNTIIYTCIYVHVPVYLLQYLTGIKLKTSFRTISIVPRPHPQSRRGFGDIEVDFLVVLCKHYSHDTIQFVYMSHEC